MVDTDYALQMMARMQIERLRLDRCLPCRVQALLRRL